MTNVFDTPACVSIFQTKHLVKENRINQKHVNQKFQKFKLSRQKPDLCAKSCIMMSDHSQSLHKRCDQLFKFGMDAKNCWQVFELCGHPSFQTT